MSEPIADPEAVARHRADEAATTTPDAEATPEGAARPCTVPVRPGYGQAAYRSGCEDEWIDRMNARYGGDW